MNKKIAEAVITLSLMLTMTGVALYSNDTVANEPVENTVCVETVEPEVVKTDIYEVGEAEELVKDPLVLDIYYETYGDYDLAEECFYDDLELLNLVTMAEAEGESDYGKRLVIDTVLNRVESPNWPNTISEVIFQKGQFSSVWNGRMDRVEVSEDVAVLISEELQSKSNSEVLYFCSNGWNSAHHLFKEGNHYFGN